MSEGDPVRPWFDAGQQQGLRDFWRIYDQHYERILADTLVVARQHPDFAPIIDAMTPEQMSAQNQESRLRLERAIAGAWGPYELELRAQGAAYAHLGLSFPGWYDLIGAFKGEMVPLLIRELAGEPDRLAGALRAMMIFVDRTMVIIGEQYLETKETKLEEQRAIAERNEQRYRMLFDHSPVPMWVYDRETQAFLAVNRAATEHYGFSEAEFLGMTIADIRFPEDLPQLEEENARDKSEQVATDLGEWRHRKKDGTPLVVELRLQNFMFAGRKAHMIVAADVTERKRAVSELERSEARYRSLVAATSAVVWTADADGNFTVPQRSWEAYTGQSAAEYAGSGWTEAIHPQDQERILAAWNAARANRELFEAEGRLIHAPSGEFRYFVARAVPLVEADCTGR